MDVKEKEKPIRMPMSTCRVVVRDSHCSQDDNDSTSVEAMVCSPVLTRNGMITAGPVFRKSWQSDFQEVGTLQELSQSQQFRSATCQSLGQNLSTPIACTFHCLATVDLSQIKIQQYPMVNLG